MSRTSVLERFSGDKQNADTARRIRRAISDHRRRQLPQVEPLDERLLLTTAVQLPNGQYLNALATLVATNVGAEVNKLLSTDDIPGMGVAVTYQGSVILDQGYVYTGDQNGTSAMDTPAVTATTPFGVGSVTKTFTAISILMIVQNPALIDTSANPGVTSLNLDAPISTYLPPGTAITLPGLNPMYPTFTLPKNWGNLTTRELLLMSSGIQDTSNTTDWNEVIAQMTGNDGNAPLEFPPGSEYLYSDVGFKLLGGLIEKLTNMTYAQFVQQQILAPLGMNQTTVLTGTNTSVPGEAVGYDSYDATTGLGTATPASDLYTGDSAFSGGAVVTTAKDLGIYMAALWNQSSLLLDPAMYQLMWTLVSLPEYGSPGTVATVGMGWEPIDVTDQGTVIEKNGSVPGYQAQLNLYTTEGFGIAVAFNVRDNSADFGAGTIADAINQAILSGMASVSGTVTDGPGGPPLAGWQVEIDETGNGQVIMGALSTTTNAQGFYRFAAVPPGEITVRLVPPGAGWSPVDPANGAITINALTSQSYAGENIVVGPLLTVTGVARVGAGRKTSIDLAFSGPLNATDAAKPTNYRVILIGRPPFRGSNITAFIPIRRAVYNAATDAVTLKTRYPVALGRKIEVEVIGSGMSSLAGVLLDGSAQGKPGTDFSAQLAPARRATLLTERLQRTNHAPADDGGTGRRGALVRGGPVAFALGKLPGTGQGGFV